MKYFRKWVDKVRTILNLILLHYILQMILIIYIELKIILMVLFCMDDNTIKKNVFTFNELDIMILKKH